MNDWLSKFTIGIPSPKQEPKTPTEMRLAIQQASRDSSLIRRCLDHGRYYGLSGEDTYVALAYYALRELERLYQANTNMLMTQYFPSRIVPPEEKQETKPL